MRILRISVALAMTAALAACGGNSSGKPGAAPPPGSMKLTIGYTAIGAAYSDLYVCEDQGIFKKHGLDVKLTLLNSSSQLLAALSSDSVQIGAGVAESTAAGALKGVDLRYLALPIPRYYQEMWGKPEITSFEQLKGKKIGLTSPGSLGDAALDAFLRDKGWTDKDVQKTFLKSIPAEVTALQQGAVDAIVTQPPNGTQTRDKGFKKILDFTEYKAAANAYTAMASYVKDNRAAVAAFLKAEVECLSILHKDKATTVASIRKHSGNDNQDLAEYSYDFFVKLWQDVPTIEPALVQDAFERAAAEAGVAAPKDAAKYVDNSFLEELKSSGFVDSLKK